MLASMALLLRLAAALDRRPAAVIAGLRVQSLSGAVSIAIEAAAPPPGQPEVDLSLERWSLRSCGPAVLEAAGLRLKVPEP